MGVFGISPFIAMENCKISSGVKDSKCGKCTPHIFANNFLKIFLLHTVQHYCSLLYGVTAIVTYACSRPTVQHYCYEHISFYIISVSYTHLTLPTKRIV